MTHGEAYVHKRANIDLRKDLVQIQKSLWKLPARMNRQEAMTYYSKKIRDYFGKKDTK